MRNPAVVDALNRQSTYRDFRNTILKNYYAEKADQRAWNDDLEVSKNDIAEMRKQIRFFRAWVCENFNEELKGGRADEQILRKALGIPPTLSLTVKQWPWWRELAQHFIPYPLLFQYVRDQMGRVRTFEGREYLFAHVYSRQFPNSGVRLYSPGLDLVLRKFPMPTWHELTDLWRQEPLWIVAAWRAGLRRIKDIEPYAAHSRERTSGWFALLMVNEGIIRSADELDWLCYPCGELGYYRYDEEQQHNSIQAISRLLLKFGVERRHIAGLYRYTYRQTDAAQLTANLNLLRDGSVKDITGVFVAVGELLWRSGTDTWRLVVEVIKARTPLAISQFLTLIANDSATPTLVVQRLQEQGADRDVLAQCQAFLVAIRDKKNAYSAVMAINLLLAPPHCLSLLQINKCVDYATAPKALKEYLDVLIQHGYSTAVDVLAFQNCYRSVGPIELSTWLTIVGVRGKGINPELIANWVKSMRISGHSDSFNYLLDTIEIRDFNSLTQAEPIVILDRGVLRYLVENRQLKTLASLRRWYFKARNVQGLRWWGRQDDEVFLLLMDDAYRRNNFAFVMHNRSCISDIVNDRINHNYPPPPYHTSGLDLAQYHIDAEAQSVLEQRRLLPMLPQVLDKTGGILLASVLRGHSLARDEVLARIETLAPMIDQLLMGRGPQSADLTELQEEVISLVYRTSIETIRNVWSVTLGRQADLDGLSLERFYPLMWQRAIRHLRLPLERSSFLAMNKANQYAELFEKCREDDCHFFQDLQSKRLLDPARDPWSLAPHLGFLLAAGGDDSEVRYWRTRGFEEIAGMTEGAQAFEHLEQLDKFFGSSLPDALDQSAEPFLLKFSSDKARILSQRLIGAAALDGLTDPVDCLRFAFEQVRKNVLAVILRWTAREKSKFGNATDSLSQTSVHAVLTKHPAAYFAKHAANLCSRDRVEMWSEKRHTHLAVFDKQQQRLVGMALVNIEIVPAIHPQRRSVIIRAINPMEDMLATHTVPSIVESCLDVAIQIANHNLLAAVLMPYHNGAHLLSNLRPVEKYLEKKYLNKAREIYPHRSEDNLLERDDENWRSKPRKFNATFSAYENGREIVSTLYAIWRGPKDTENGRENTT